MALRRRVKKHRTSLQKKGTKNARRRLQKQSRRQSRYSQWLNHNIAKHIVQSANNCCKAIALENLEGIRERASAVIEKLPKHCTIAVSLRLLNGYGLCNL